MTASQEATTEDLAGQLAALAAELDELGMRTRAVPGRFPPRLEVTNSQVAHLSEVIYAAKSRHGDPWFWWSWGERIDEISNTGAVAARIARVLA